jgi:hypothetical protein
MSVWSGDGHFPDGNLQWRCARSKGVLGSLAVTLLIVDLRVPDVAHLQSGRQLRHTIPQMGRFAYSFAAVGLFWLAHHDLFRYIKGGGPPASAAQFVVSGHDRLCALPDRPAERGR